MKISMIVHGGAWDIPDEEVEAHRRGCRRALLAGWEVLQAGGRVLDAVERAIVVMEGDPTFDAGVGSFLNAEGVVELDAGLMDGRDLNAGAVMAVPNVKNPIVLARRVLASEYVYIVGPGASRFAREVGLEECQPRELIVERERKRWEERSSTRWDIFGRDTVGAVALDRQGNVAAGTSTGGSPFKPPGRVGDSPLVGCGYYADSTAGGASSTGHGEAIIKITMAKSAVDFLRQMSAQEAAEAAIRLLAERLDSRGGVILIDREGAIGCAFNTPRMARAYLSEGMQAPVVEV